MFPKRRRPMTDRRNFYVADTKVINEQQCCDDGYRLLREGVYTEYAIHCHPSPLDDATVACVSPTMRLPEGGIDNSKRYCYVVCLQADGESTEKEPVIPSSTEEMGAEDDG
jgi:hypothetical protein